MCIRDRRGSPYISCAGFGGYGGLWTDFIEEHSGDPAPWLHQRPWVAPARLSGRGAHSVGGDEPVSYTHLVSQAVEEIYEGKVTYQRVRDGIK